MLELPNFGVSNCVTGQSLRKSEMTFCIVGPFWAALPMELNVTGTLSIAPWNTWPNPVATMIAEIITSSSG